MPYALPVYNPGMHPFLTPQQAHTDARLQMLSSPSRASRPLLDVRRGVLRRLTATSRPAEETSPAALQTSPPPALPKSPAVQRLRTATRDAQYVHRKP